MRFLADKIGPLVRVAVIPRRRNEALIRVVDTERGNEAVNRASCSSRLGSDPIHSHGKHIIVGDVIRDEK